jgi:hypothetical protein
VLILTRIIILIGAGSTRYTKFFRTVRRSAGRPSFHAAANTPYSGANRSETELLVEDAITIFRSRLFPGYAEYFPGSGVKNSRLCRYGNLPASL